MKKISSLVSFAIASFLAIPALSLTLSAPQSDPSAKPVVYTNKQYGFRVSLPQSWKGYTVETDTWKGSILQGPNANQVESGPLVRIRHPLWTEKDPRQDIPIMIFTPEQWTLIEAETLSVSAAPIGPSELARNDKYVFALPARYNFAYLPGWEEVDKLLKGNPMKPL